MSKQRVSIIKVENDIMYEKDIRFGGGQQHGSRITYEQTVDGAKSTETKTLSDYTLNQSPALRAQLQALSTASLPVEAVIERVQRVMQNGKSYEAINAILPKTTPITPEEEYKPKPAFTGRKGGGGYTASPKTTALHAASRLGGTAEEVIANAKKFEAYLAESSEKKAGGSSETPAPVEQTVKYEF